MRISQENCVFLMIDIQEKFAGKIAEIELVKSVASTLNKASEILNIPLIITEQYPKGLGNTMKDIYLPEKHNLFEKTKFSALTDKVVETINSLQKKWLVLYGIETHVCLAQTALEAIEMGFNVMFVVDGISSRKIDDKQIALRRLEKSGVILTTKEMLLFELMKDANHKSFKDISKLVK